MARASAPPAVSPGTRRGPEHYFIGDRPAHVDGDGAAEELEEAELLRQASLVFRARWLGACGGAWRGVVRRSAQAREDAGIEGRRVRAALDVSALFGAWRRHAELAGRALARARLAERTGWVLGPGGRLRAEAGGSAALQAWRATVAATRKSRCVRFAVTPPARPASGSPPPLAHGAEAHEAPPLAPVPPWPGEGASAEEGAQKLLAEVAAGWTGSDDGELPDTATQATVIYRSGGHITKFDADRLRRARVGQEAAMRRAAAAAAWREQAALAETEHGEALLVKALAAATPDVPKAVRHAIADAALRRARAAREHLENLQSAAVRRAAG